VKLVTMRHARHISARKAVMFSDILVCLRLKNLLFYCNYNIAALGDLIIWLFIIASRKDSFENGMCGSE